VRMFSHPLADDTTFPLAAATLANVNRIGIVGMLRADDLVSFVSRRTSPSCRGCYGRPDDQN
jgi:hypothetical protein